MKKLIILGIAAMGVIVAIDKSKQIKDGIGKTLGYDDCPNCGDNMYWKGTSSILYSKVVEGGDPLGSSEAVLPGIYRYRTMVCSECKSNPEGLDANAVGKFLKDLKYEPESIKVAQEAILSFKEKSKKA